MTTNLHPDLVELFDAALDAEDFDAGDLDVKALSLVAVEWANSTALTDPLLGLGRDARAVFALSTGIVRGVLAYRAALSNSAPDWGELALRLGDAAALIADAGHMLENDVVSVHDVGPLLSAIEHALAGEPSHAELDFNARRLGALERFYRCGGLTGTPSPLPTDG